jgi:hypothetical protein
MQAALIAQLEQQAAALSERVLHEMYEDPFWDARYGERGRKYTREDMLHHISHLNQALAAADHALFVKYARWLRSVPTSRGLCTLHLVDNFERLSRAIADRIADAEPACHALEAGIDGLGYHAGLAAELGALQAGLIDALARRAQDAATGAKSAQFHRREARKLVSYLADTLDSGRRDRFFEHRRWLDQYAREQGLPADYYLQLMAASVAELERSASGSAPLRAAVAELAAAPGTTP